MVMTPTMLLIVSVTKRWSILWTRLTLAGRRQTKRVILSTRSTWFARLRLDATTAAVERGEEVSWNNMASDLSSISNSWSTWEWCFASTSAWPSPQSSSTSRETSFLAPVCLRLSQQHPSVTLVQQVQLAMNLDSISFLRILICSIQRPLSHSDVLLATFTLSPNLVKSLSMITSIVNNWLKLTVQIRQSSNFIPTPVIRINFPLAAAIDLTHCSKNSAKVNHPAPSSSSKTIYH